MLLPSSTVFGFPAKLEPSGLSKDGSKRPELVHLLKFQDRDSTCSDTLAPSHVEKSSIEAGKTAVWAEENKFTTYGNALRDDYHFVPIAVETFGSWGPIGHKFITDIGRSEFVKTQNALYVSR